MKRIFTEEHIRKLSESHKGQKPVFSFKKGHIPWNKDTKGIMKSNETSFKKGTEPFNKGKKLSPKHLKNLIKSHQGPKPWLIGVPRLDITNNKHPLWKGDDVGYEALHTWVKRSFGKPNKCEMPGCIYPRKNSNGKIMNKPFRYEWSNKDGKYLRDRETWWMLCPSCHQKYDFERKKER